MPDYRQMAWDYGERIIGKGFGDLFVALVQQESGFNPTIESPAGAVGLAQLMPATAAGLGVTNRKDPHQSLDGGARYLRQMIDFFDGDVRKAVAAYNAGPGRVQQAVRAGGANWDTTGLKAVMSPAGFNETSLYLRKVYDPVYGSGKKAPSSAPPSSGATQGAQMGSTQPPAVLGTPEAPTPDQTVAPKGVFALNPNWVQEAPDFVIQSILRSMPQIGQQAQQQQQSMPAFDPVQFQNALNMLTQLRDSAAGGWQTPGAMTAPAPSIQPPQSITAPLTIQPPALGQGVNPAGVQGLPANPLEGWVRNGFEVTPPPGWVNPDPGMARTVGSGSIDPGFAQPIPQGWNPLSLFGGLPW